MIEVVSERVTDALEASLEEARAGKVREVHLVMRMTDGTLCFRSSRQEDIIETIGAIEVIKDTILHAPEGS